MIDIHSHVLPGIDDGAKTIEESMEIIKKASKNGVTDLIVTPHFILGSDYSTNNETKRKLVAKLKRLIKKEQLPINIYLGNEVFIENNILELKKDKLISTLNNSKYLLMELPLNDYHNHVDDILFNLNCNKINVVLAHPERYSCVCKDPNLVLNWIKKGALLQCNLGSFLGIYGKETKKMAMLFLKHHAISFIGSDIHRASSTYYERINEVKEMMRQYISEEEIEAIFINNSKKVINKELVVTPAVVPFKKSIFGSWK